MTELENFCCELVHLMQLYNISLEKLDKVVEIIHRQEETVLSSFQELQNMFRDE